MSDWTACVMLAAAAFLAVAVRLRPSGGNARRSPLLLAGCMALMAITGLAGPGGPLRSLPPLVQLVLAIAAVGFTLLGFRPSEHAEVRRDP